MRNPLSLLLLAGFLAMALPARAQDSGAPAVDVHGHPMPAAGTADFLPSVKGEGRLLRRLIAPCCWTGTLQGHHSAVVETLKQEIRARLLAGESPDAIEKDMIVRYGDKIRALPQGWTLDSTLGYFLLGLVVSLAMIVGLGQRWRKRTQTAAVPEPVAGAGVVKTRDKWDDALDDELADMR